MKQDEINFVVKLEIDKALEKLKTETRAKLAEIEANYSTLTKGAFENLSIETLQGMIYLNRNLTGEQKRRIMVLLQTAKIDTPFFG